MQGHLKINIDLFSALCPPQLHKTDDLQITNFQNSEAAHVLPFLFSIRLTGHYSVMLTFLCLKCFYLQINNRVYMHCTVYKCSRNISLKYIRNSDS